MPPTLKTAAPQSPSVGAPMAINPFTRSSIEHVEPAAFDRTNQLTASSVVLGPDSLPSYGYLRAVYLLVSTAAGGGAGASTYQPDAPFSALDEVVLQDINGTPLVQVSGYELYLINAFGGYNFSDDPTLMPEYSLVTTGGSFTFSLRIPVEIIARLGLGALENMNAASAYQLRITQAATTSIWSSNPATTIPTMRVRVWVECWAPPGDRDASGTPNAIRPPADGTTQYWTRQSGITVAVGQNTAQVRRVGNLIRNLIVVSRTGAGVRADNVFVEPIQLTWDGRIIVAEPQVLRKRYTRQRFGIPAPTGVFIYDFTHDFTGHCGDGEMRDIYLKTASSSRLEFSGVSAAAGSLSILVNDVIPGADLYADV